MDQGSFNWLDLLFVLSLGAAAVRGFQRGFIVEICSLIALWLGVYAALHFSGYVSAWLELGEERQILAFVITFLAVLLLVHLLAKTLTVLIEIALLGWANKLAGVLAAIIRSAFMLSIMLNILLAYTDNALPPQQIRERSALHGPIRAFAPILLPQLGETKWVSEMIELLKTEVVRDLPEEGSLQ